MRFPLVISLLLFLLSGMAQEPADTVSPPPKYWKDELKHLRIDINDTVTHYPKFLKFVYKSARWVTKALYTYDTTYVDGFDNTWRFMIKNNNWFDSYVGHLAMNDLKVRMTSNVTSKFGGHISYKGFGLGYMLNFRDILTGRRLDNRRWDGSINTSRLSLEWYFTKDRSEINIHRFGDYGKNGWKSYRYDGLTREAYGLYGYYFFNHRHYCQSAGYGISRRQLRSAGSFLLGVHVSSQDIHMDFSSLTDEMKSYLPDDNYDVRFHYHDYCFLVGYGYNWVPRHRWLVNITAIPSVGLRQSHKTSVEGAKSMFSTNIRLKVAVVLNRKKWSYGLNIVSDGHWYLSKTHSFFNSSQDINLAVGFRLF